MTGIEAVEQAILELHDQIRPLVQQRDDLSNKLRRLRSREFIRVNGITLSDVEMSEGDGKPYFGVADQFREWVYENSRKRWMEWNGRIYHRDFTETPGLVEDLG